MRKVGNIRPKAVYLFKVAIGSVILLVIIVNTIWMLLSSKFR